MKKTTIAASVIIAALMFTLSIVYSCQHQPQELPSEEVWTAKTNTDSMVAPIEQSGYGRSAWYFVRSIRDTLEDTALDTFQVGWTFTEVGTFTWEVVQDTLSGTIGGKLYFETLANHLSSAWKIVDSLTLTPGDKVYPLVSYTDLATGTGGVEAYENIARTRMRSAQTGTNETILEARLTFKGI